MVSGAGAAGENGKGAWAVALGKWYPVDNAGTLYAAIQSDAYSPVYRFSAVLAERVEPQALQRAVDKTLPRFPTFDLRLKKGAFWHYLEPDDRPAPQVAQDVRNCCQPMDVGSGARLLRVFYYERRVSIECFHALSDGAGAMIFFKTLLAVYLRERGAQIPNACGILDVDEPPRPEEAEDAYLRWAGGKAARGGWKKTAYRPTGRPEPYYTLNVTQGLLSVAQVKAKAKSMGASVTEYLSGTLVWTLLERQRREEPGRGRPVALAIPINLRPFFPSETLRNFILTARLSIDPALGDYTFPEVVEQLHHQLRLETSRPLMRGRITGNVNFQKNPFLKVIPSAVKDPVMTLSYKLAAIRPNSTTFTNPGVFTVPPEMAPYLQRMEAILGQPYGNTVNCAAISFQDVLSISFAGNIRERDVEGGFFRFLVEEGLHVKVLSNRPDPL